MENNVNGRADAFANCTVEMMCGGNAAGHGTMLGHGAGCGVPYFDEVAEFVTFGQGRACGRSFDPGTAALGRGYGIGTGSEEGWSD